MSKLEIKSYTKIENNTTHYTQSTNLSSPNTTQYNLKKTTKKVIITEPEIKIENKKEKSLKQNKNIQRIFKGNDSYLGVPRMVQIIEYNKKIKQDMMERPWKYSNQNQKSEPKKPSKLKNLIYSQFHLNNNQ